MAEESKEAARPTRAYRGNPKKAGVLLRRYRERVAMSQERLAGFLHTTKRCISHWETGVTLVDPAAIRRMKLLLHLSPQEETALMLARFPALDPWWLHRRDSIKKPGLLLAAYRERASFTQEAFAERLSVSRRSVADWEDGSSAIDQKWITAAANTLKLEPDEIQWLCLARWPALDKKWLRSQPPRRQPSLVLVALRERLGLTQDELADAVGLSRRTILRWESGESHVTGPKADRLASYFAASEARLSTPMRLFADSDWDQFRAVWTRR